MKEDILEQLVDDYLQSEGYFTRHNLKFKPDPAHPHFESDQDSNHSDIDVLGVHPTKTGHDRVWVVSCKSWQKGFRVAEKIAEIQQNKVRSGREAWRGFRELVQPKWSDAFVRAVEDATGSRQFTYVTAVTRIHGDPALWEQHAPFRIAIGDNPIRLLALADLVEAMWSHLGTTLASSELGRVLQLLKASGCIRIVPPRLATSEP